MTAKWTSGLEAAIRDYAAFEERSWARLNAPAPESLTEVWDALEAETVDKKLNGLPNLAIIARATGLPMEFSADNMQKIVDFARANGSDAADKLRDIIPHARLLIFYHLLLLLQRALHM